MENSNGFYVNIQQLRDERPEDESLNFAGNDDSLLANIPQHDYGEESEESKFPYSRSSDTEALDSVYKYTKKIKSFLGWEKEDDSDHEQKFENSARADSCDSTDQGFYSNSATADEGSFTQPNVHEDQIKKEVGAENPDQVASIQSVKEYDQSSLDEGEKFSDYISEFSESETIGLSQMSSAESEFESDDDKSSGQKVFRSKITIFISDCRNGVSTSGVKVKSTLNNAKEGIVETAELLVQGDESETDAFIEDAVDVTAVASKSSDTEDKFDCSDDNLKGVNSKDILDTSKASNEKQELGHDESASKESENEFDLNKNEPFNTNSPGFTTDNISGDINGKETKENSTLELCNINEKNGQNDKGDSQACELREKYDVNSPRKHMSQSNIKRPKEHFLKITQEDNPMKSYSSLKASVHYAKVEKGFSSSPQALRTAKQGLNSADNDLYDHDTRCGIGIFKPRWLQSFATPKMYVILYSIIGILHGSYYSYLIGTLSTLEKRFAFKSKISGAIMVADEATPLLLGVILGFYGGRAHRPRMVAVGMLLSVGCCFFSSLPYFIYGPVQHLSLQSFQNRTGPDYCDANIGNESCDLDERPPTVPAVLILVLGSFLKGFGNIAYYAIGLAYLDDNADKASTPIYLAVALALRLLGPLVGFLMSSAFLKIYENPFEDPGFGPDDPRWIGAWWMGFFLQGVLLVIFTLPIALFPRRLPGQKRIEKSPQPTNKESLKETFAGLWSALKRLGKNPIFILLIINTTMKIFGHFGHAIMLPKYMENQFRLSAADASLFSGATSILCVMLSTVFGGFLIWKFRPRIKLLLAGMATSELILSIGFLTLMIPRCQPADMLHFGVNDAGLILDSPCNQNCDCSTTSFTPFCGSDGKTTYFSPCYAGCTQDLSPLITSKNQTIFGNCSCVNTSNSSDVVSATITEGFCPDKNCWSKALAYLIILFTLLTISSSLTVAHTMILLRSVHPSDKSVALGTFETFICLFGFIPFPVTFGALVDSACLVWEESCGETGNCWFYDMDKYGYLLHGAAAIFCFLSTICLTCLYFLSSRVRNLYVDEDEGEERVDSIKLDTVSGSVTKL